MNKNQVLVAITETKNELLNAKSDIEKQTGNQKSGVSDDHMMGIVEGIEMSIAHLNGLATVIESTTEHDVIDGIKPRYFIMNDDGSWYGLSYSTEAEANHEIEELEKTFGEGVFYVDTQKD